MISDSIYEALYPLMDDLAHYSVEPYEYDQETFNTIFDALLQLQKVAVKLDGGLSVGDPSYGLEDKYKNNLLLNFARNMEEDDFYAIYTRMGKWMLGDSHITA